MWRIGNWIEKLVSSFTEMFNPISQALSWQRNNRNIRIAKKQEKYFQSISKEEAQGYFQFLMEVLHATAESKGNAQIVYPLLLKNSEKLNEGLREILHQWATDKIWEVQKDEAEYLAAVIVLLSHLIQQFPLGNGSSNIEIAITGYEIALMVYTRQDFPQDWAMAKDNLGEAYCNRILGEQRENLEKAIIHLQEALQIWTFETFPVGWARAQCNLGAALSKRIVGKRAQNLEQAIACYQEALKVYTFDNYPVNWAAIHNNLGLTYTDRILGEKAQNLEEAIACYQEALQVYTFGNYPVGWSATQNNLANTYSKRILGDQSQNLEQAITCYQEALKVSTFEDFPADWAQTCSNLGDTYRRRIEGDRAENLEQAIICFQEALKVYTLEDFPFDWAGTQNNLAGAYCSRIKGNQAENLEQAIACLLEALKVWTYDNFPTGWATTQDNLANAYYYRLEGERAENLEKAIVCYQEALKVYTFEDFPFEWAATQDNLASTYRKRIKGEQAKNLEKGIAAYKEALKVRTFETFPQQYAETIWNLVIAYQITKQFVLAHDTLKQAIDTVESLRDEIVSSEETKRKHAETWTGLYRCMVEICLALGNTSLAIEYVERSKTRNLVEQILERDSEIMFPPEVFAKLQKYKEEIAAGQGQIQNSKTDNLQALIQHLQKLRQERNKIQDRYLPVGYSFKFELFQRNLDDKTAIVEFYVLNDQVLMFVVLKEGEPTVLQIQSKDRKALGSWLNQYLQNQCGKDEFKSRLEEELKTLASILHIDEILNKIPKQCDRLIIIPHQFLHLFPLHSLPINQGSDNSLCLLDLFTSGVSYAPSCQLLQQIQHRKRPDFRSLFAVQNPTDDLNYTDLEVQVIQSYFNDSNVIKKSAATLTAINNTYLNAYHCIHFSCHGYFNSTNPSKSALILAESHVTDMPTQTGSERYLSVRLGETRDLDKCLTLDKLFGLNLEKCRLVTLSACETGVIDFSNTSDEYIGLPSGFLLAGSPSVVSSLWRVHDVSTSLLMIKFYENLSKFARLEAGDVAIALNQAQTWLRNLSIEKLDVFLVEHRFQIEGVLAQLRPGQQARFEESLKLIKKRQSRPFTNPYYWAGFIASGR